MKKSITLFTLLTLLFFTSNSFAEQLGLKVSNLNLSVAADKEKKSSSTGIHKGLVQLDLSLNLGSNGPFYINNHYKKGYPVGYAYRFGIGFRPGFTLNVDVAVHKYVSVGGYFGLDASVINHSFHGYTYSDRNVGVAFGARGVFHIYQLIADKSNTKVSPGKLDFYLALHIGGIIYFNTNNDFINAGYSRSYGGLSVGPSLGVRYYFNNRIGILGEVGWNEMSIFKLGLAVKL